MRVLLTTTGGAGHVGPLIPFADALLDAGDELMVATRESRADQVRAAGYDVWPCADAPAAERDAIVDEARHLPDDDANVRVVADLFARLDARAALFPGLYRAAIETLAPLPVRLLITIGRDRDPAELGPLPPNVHVERWVPQADVMPHAAAMVCHGGFGTVRTGLAASVPMVVQPLFADQPYNARRVAELGAGIALEQGPRGIAGAPAAVRTLLADRAYADRAAAVARRRPCAPDGRRRGGDRAPARRPAAAGAAERDVGRRLREWRASVRELHP
jgi:UDP:flavonoid glycosyltransferase YjiC (YdhE family)